MYGIERRRDRPSRRGANAAAIRRAPAVSFVPATRRLATRRHAVRPRLDVREVLERGEVLVAAAGEPEQDEDIVRPAAPSHRCPASSEGSAAIAWAVSSAGRMPSVRVHVRIAATASRSVAEATSIRPPSASAESCGPMPG